MKNFIEKVGKLLSGKGAAVASMLLTGGAALLATAVNDQKQKKLIDEAVAKQIKEKK